MSFPRYPKYKDSGVEWLGEVPEGWEIQPIKAVASCNDDVLGESTGEDYQLEYVEISDVDVNRGITGSTLYSFREAPSRARRQVKDGDVIVSTVRTYLRAIAPVHNPTENLTVSTGFAVIRPQSVLSGFIGYFFLSEYLMAEVISRSVGVSYPAINASQLMQLVAAIPPPEEQQAITSFLDRETAKIDALVAEQENLIALLKEKRQAVISHAVTKGLDPTVPMKDSGIEWLGEVPAHWSVKRLKHVAHLIDGDRGASYPSDTDLIEDGYPFLSSKNIVGYKFSLDGIRYISKEKFDSLTRGKTKDGDLVITVRGTIGHVAIYDAKAIGFESAFINAQMMIIRPIKLEAHLLQAICESEPWKRQLDIASYGTAQQQLSNQVLQDVWLTIPPRDEQITLIAFLIDQITKLDELTTEAQHTIDLLKERRSALISAAVTGKIDVRGLVNKEAA